MALHKLRTPKDLLVYFTATFFGSGLSPYAPGTAGTVAAMPLVFLMSLTDTPARFVFWALLTAAGTWAARRFDELQESHDHSCIVIDEVVGMGIAGWSSGGEPVTLLVAFIAFRLLDIFKPAPIRQLDTWSKSRTGTPGGFGVMADDLLAGFLTLIGVSILQWVGILP